MSWQPPTVISLCRTCNLSYPLRVALRHCQVPTLLVRDLIFLFKTSPLYGRSSEVENSTWWGGFLHCYNFLVCYLRQDSHICLHTDRLSLMTDISALFHLIWSKETLFNISRRPNQPLGITNGVRTDFKVIQKKIYQSQHWHIDLDKSLSNILPCFFMKIFLHLLINLIHTTKYQWDIYWVK